MGYGKAGRMRYREEAGGDLPPGMGYGKAGRMRHRVILRDSIYGITKPAIRRLMHRGGVKQMSGLVYEEMRGVVKHLLEKIIRNAIISMEHRRAKTVSFMDYKVAGRELGLHSISATHFPKACGSKKRRVQKDEQSGGWYDEELRNNEDEEVDSDDDDEEQSGGRLRDNCSNHSTGDEHEQSGGRRHRSGYHGLRNIRKQQKLGCLLLPHAAVSRLVREIAQDFKQDIRHSKTSLIYVQALLEHNIVSLSEDANLMAIHAKRSTVQPKDIHKARQLRGDLD